MLVIINSGKERLAMRVPLLVSKDNSLELSKIGSIITEDAIWMPKHEFGYSSVLGVVLPINLLALASVIFTL